MPTMKDVARLAGVSVATVSCALSGTKGVAPATYKRILTAISELNYVPNLSARNLKLPTSNEIGLVFTDIGNTFQADFLKGVFTPMQQAGFQVTVTYSENIPDNETERLKSLIGKNISGLILFTCQPENTALFQHILQEKNIPTVFVERAPAGLNCNFICFDNFQTISGITQRLIDLGYARPSLVMGPSSLSCEKKCLDGFLDTLAQNNISREESMICQTQLSKEAAFKATLFAYEHTLPDAVITTSTELARGVCEALRINNLNPSTDIPVIALGEESWLHTNIPHGFLKTARSAITQGIRAAELLLQNIHSPVLFEKQHIVMEDSFNPAAELTAVRRPLKPSGNITVSRPSLRLLMVNSAISSAIRILSRDFARTYGIDISIETQHVSQILNTIRQENAPDACAHDIFMFDIPWLPNIATNGLLADISDLVADADLETNHFLPENLESCKYNNRYYGIPVIGGSQLLLYRKDYFENPTYQNDFEKQYRIRLRPPVTWTEFNGICRFFTRSCNPKSPTEFGTSIAMRSPGDLSYFLYPYIWAHGGDIFNSHGSLQLDSVPNALAIGDFLQTLQYTDGNYANTSLDDTINQFKSGRIAMLVVFSQSLCNQNIQDTLGNKTGYALLPRKHSILPGWNFGVSNYTDKKEYIMKFFQWFCQRHISYYLTILTGHSTVIAPYENRELNRLYPWLSLAAQGLKYGHLRTTAHQSGWHMIPQDSIEGIIAESVNHILSEGAEISASLKEAEAKLRQLYQSTLV